MKDDSYYCCKREQWVFGYDSFEDEFWRTKKNTPVAMLDVTAEELYSLFKNRLETEREQSE